MEYVSNDISSHDFSLNSIPDIGRSDLGPKVHHNMLYEPKSREKEEHQVCRNYRSAGETNPVNVVD